MWGTDSWGETFWGHGPTSMAQWGADRWGEMYWGYAPSAMAQWGGENWGEMIWGAGVALPMTLIGVLAIVLAVTGKTLARRSQPKAKRI